MDDEVLDPKEIDDAEDIEDDMDDLLAPGKKKPKKVGEDDLLADTTDSLDEMAEAELGEDEPYDDVDKW